MWKYHLQNNYYHYSKHYRLSVDPTTIALIAAWIDEGALSEPYEPLQGDVNDDGTVNILDIVQLANMILSDEYQESADLNGDGNLNILDVVQLVNIIFSG